MGRRRGMALAAAMALSVVLLGLATVMVGEASWAGRQTVQSTQRLQAYHLARSALARGMAELNSSGPDGLRNPMSRTVAGGTFRVWTEQRTDAPSTVFMHGKGTVEGVEVELTRTCAVKQPDKLTPIVAGFGFDASGQYSIVQYDPNTSTWDSKQPVPYTPEWGAPEMGVDSANNPYLMLEPALQSGNPNQLGLMRRNGTTWLAPEVINPPGGDRYYLAAGDYIYASGNGNVHVRQVNGSAWTALPSLTGLNSVVGRDDKGGIYAKGVENVAGPFPGSTGVFYAYLASGATAWTRLPTVPWSNDALSNFIQSGDGTRGFGGTVTHDGKLVVSAGAFNGQRIYEATSAGWSAPLDVPGGSGTDPLEIHPDANKGYYVVKNWIWGITNTAILHREKGQWSEMAKPSMDQTNWGRLQVYNTGSLDSSTNNGPRQYGALWEFP